MGTTIIDLHAHIEVKKDGKWLHYGCPNITRDYLVFACINGTCKDTFEENVDLYDRIRPVTTIHEIPNDISEVTKICLETDSNQYKIKGFGVLSKTDLENLQRQLYGFSNPQENGGYDLEEDVFKTYIGGNSIARHEGFDDVRVVFWFDN